MLKRWGRWTFWLLLTGLIGLGLVVQASASPGLINFQGRLTDSGGTPVTTTATLTVRIFSTETGGTAEWAETHPSVAVQEGIYNVLLGSVQSFPADLFLNDGRWFEVEVNGEILTPRQRMTSVAYALEADHAGSADEAVTVIANGVTTTMIQDAAVENAKLASGAVTGAKIADGTITSAKIVGGAGSGLNADLLDGFHSTAFASVGHAHDARYAPSVHDHNDTYYDKAYVNALEARIAALEDLLQHFSRNGNEIIVTGANLNILSGSGATDAIPNGLGNLVVGYNELRGDLTDDRTGSHNLVVGSGLSHSSYGGIVAGSYNTISGRFASVTGGEFNEASGDFASVTSGYYNTASGSYASVSGGGDNTAAGTKSSVSGGQLNAAGGIVASVSGGQSNSAQAFGSAVHGGLSNSVIANANFSVIAGGSNNTASGRYGAVSGGKNNEAFAHYGAILGGDYNTVGDLFLADRTVGEYGTVAGGTNNTASGDYATVSGGSANVAAGDYATVSGGTDNDALDLSATVSGGFQNNASGWYATVGGGQENTASGDSSTVGGGYQRSTVPTGEFDWTAGTLFEDQ